MYLFIAYFILYFAVLILLIIHHSIHGLMVASFMLGCWILVWYSYDPEEKPCHYVSCVVLILTQLVLFFYFNAFVQESSPNWPLHSFSPCGTSSCYSIPDHTNLTYNPHGRNTPNSPYQLFCPYKECRWADVNWIPPNGYPAHPITQMPDTSQPACDLNSCVSLATDRKQDYLDLGTGLTSGLTLGVTTTADLKPCPLVDKLALQEDGVTHGVGLPICAFCSHYFYELNDIHFPEPGAYCPKPTTPDYLCGLCMDVSMRQDDVGRKLTAWCFMSLTIVSTVYVLLTVLIRTQIFKHGKDNKKAS